MIDRISRLYPKVLVNQLIYSDILEISDLTNKERLNQFGETYIASLTDDETDGASYSFSVEEDAERSSFYISIILRQHGIDTEYKFDHDFVDSTEYTKIKELNKAINGIMEEGAYVKRGEKTFAVSDFVSALEWLMSESKRGQYIQRYKGLGEMNPSQLWETTMDPANRRMLQVTVEDAIGADLLFTTLMGDQVEPRRNFIEENALRVANLDV